MSSPRQDPRQQLLGLLAHKSFRLGEFKLSSGGTSDYYIDCRTTTLDAEGARLTARVFLDEYRLPAYLSRHKRGKMARREILGELTHLAVAGVMLYDGIGELELASVYDTYAATYTTKLLSVSPQWIVAAKSAE